MKKRIAFLLALSMLLVALIACKSPAADIVTLYEGNGLKIEREGAVTRVHDLTGGAMYTFTAHRQRVVRGAAELVKVAMIAADTPTVKIQTVHGLIIIEAKSSGVTLYVRG